MPNNSSDNNRSNQQEEREGKETNTLQVESEVLKKGFTLIPNYVIRSRNLSRDAKLLYGILLSYAWQTDSCFPGYDTLMEDMQCGRPQVSKYIKELKEAGLIDVKRRGQGLTSIYTIKDVSPQKFQNETSKSFKTKKQEVSKRNANNTQSNNTQKKNTKYNSKGQSPYSQKGTDEVSTDTRSHIAHSAIRNRGNTEGNERTVSKGEASKAAVSSTLTAPPITQDEINEKKAQGRNASGFQHIGVSLEHMHILERQFGRSTGSPPENPHSRQQGNSKKAPLFIQGTIGDWFSLEMHDQAINSTITRCHRIYQRWKQNYPEATPEDLQDGFYTMMQEARTKSKHANIKTRTPKGQPNRTPFFLACLEELCGLKNEQPPN